MTLYTEEKKIKTSGVRNGNIHKFKSSQVLRTSQKRKWSALLDVLLFFVNTLILEYEVNNMNLDACLPGVVRPLYKQQVIMR